MTGSQGEMGSLLRQAREMQRELDRVRSELRSAVLEGTAGGGAVRIQIGGDRSPKRVEIAPDVVASGDRALLEDLVLAALRDALSKADALAEESMGRVTGGINLPGIL